MELSEYLVVCRGSPPLVAGLALGEGARLGWEPLAPAADAARPTAADVDLAGGYLYYCDVHRCVLVRRDRSVRGANNVDVESVAGTRSCGSG